MGPLKSISTTFGTTPGAVLKLSAKGGTITLKIPEGALYAGTNIIFKVAGGKAKKKPKVLGTVVYLEPILGGKRWSKGIKSDGPAFEFRMPLVGKDSVNLAVGAFEITSDGTGGEVTWTVHAPTRVEWGFGEAYFHLPSIHPSYIYATTDEPTAP